MTYTIQLITTVPGGAALKPGLDVDLPNVTALTSPVTSEMVMGHTANHLTMVNGDDIMITLDFVVTGLIKRPNRGIEDLREPTELEIDRFAAGLSHTGNHNWIIAGQDTVMSATTVAGYVVG